MAFSALTSDSFNRADGTLDGSTLNNAGGGAESNVWTSTSWTISSNQAFGPGTDGPIAYPASTAAVDKQRVSSILGNASSVVARYVVANGSCFFAYKNGADLILQYFDGGTGYTSIETATGALSGGETVSITANGTSITCQVNGSTVITQTHASNPTGVGGLRAGGTTTFDDFLYETDSGGGGTPVGADAMHYYVQSHAR